MGDAMRLIDNLGDTFCCQKLQCFKHSNQGYLSEKMKYYLAISSESRKMTLKSILSSVNFFTFDGKLVFSTFLLKEFRFTRSMQHAVQKSMETASFSGQITSRMEGSESASMGEQFDDKLSPSRG